MATSVVFPRVQFFANNGRPLIGGRIHTYVAGSSTRARTYKDAAKAQPNANPIILDARGEASVYLAEGVEYKFVIEDSTGALIMTQEPVYGAIWPNAAEWPSDATLSYKYMTEAKAAAGAIGPVKFYDTKAQADAAIGTMANGDIIEVAIDETRAGARTRYRVQGGALVFVVNLDNIRAGMAEGEKSQVRMYIDAQMRFRHPVMSDVSHSGGNYSLALDGQVAQGDLRGALYEKDVQNAAMYSEDLKLTVDGVPYVNRQGWQRCYGKRYGRVVVYGSSTPAGVGVSDYFAPSAANGWTESGNSWVGRMRAALGDEAEIINRSFAGAASQGAIDRFWRDVAPYSPDTVIISTGYVNEGAISPESRRAADVYTRLLRLCSMCSRIGAKPIVMITMAGSDPTLIRTYAIAQALRASGITVWDISCAVKDINSNTISSDYAADGSHANDAGHARYFQNINISDLEVDFRGASLGGFSRILGRDGFYKVEATSIGGEEYAPLTAIFSGNRPKDIFVSVRAKALLASGNTQGCLLNINTTATSEHPDISIRTSAGKWAMYADGVVVATSSVDWDKAGYTTAAVSYDRGRNRFDYYHDGVFVASHTPAKVPTTDAGWAWARAGGTSGFWRLGGWEIHDFVVTRNPSMNGYGLRGAGNVAVAMSLPLPSTMGARFALQGAENRLGVVTNIEGDLSSRLIMSNATVQSYMGAS